MIVVHHLENSRSQRVLWLLEELGLEYRVQRYKRDPETLLAPPELRKIHRLGKSPVIVDGDVTLAESGAIAEYLVDKYGNGRLRPQRGTPAATRYVYWLHYAEGSAMPPLLMKLVFERIPKGKMPFFARPVARAISAKVLSTFVMPQIRLHMEHMEAELGKDPWFAGDEFTAADIQMSYALEAAAARGGIGEKQPNLKAWLDRIHARPAYRKAVEKNGPNSIPG